MGSATPTTGQWSACWTETRGSPQQGEIIGTTAADRAQQSGGASSLCIAHLLGRSTLFTVSGIAIDSSFLPLLLWPLSSVLCQLASNIHSPDLSLPLLSNPSL